MSRGADAGTGTVKRAMAAVASARRWDMSHVIVPEKGLVNVGPFAVANAQTTKHPNIAHIHGLEKSDGTLALVMELVEGPTLADRIRRSRDLRARRPAAAAVARVRRVAEEWHPRAPGLLGSRFD